MDPDEVVSGLEKQKTALEDLADKLEPLKKRDFDGMAEKAERAKDTASVLLGGVVECLEAVEVDYIFMKTQDPDDSLATVLSGMSSRAGYGFGRVVPRRGRDAYAHAGPG